jgi:hypothetical protein
MIVMEFFYSIYLGTLIIRVSREGVHESVDFSDFWNILCLKVSLIRRRSHKKCSILEKKSEHTILTHSRVTDISVSDIHRILGKYTIAHCESDLLIPDHQPRVMPEIVLISEDNNGKYEKSYYSPYERITRREIDYTRERHDDKYKKLE